MSEAEILLKLRLLPKEKQAEIFDFIDYLVGRFGTRNGEAWTDPAFAEFAFGQALRGLEDDPVTYGSEDIRGRWE